MKTKVLLAVAFLAIISTIGVSQDKKSQPATESDKATKAELDRISKLPIEAQSLTGVKSIWIGIRIFGEEAKSAGLTEEQLKEDVESKFQLAGIKVNSQEEWSASEDRAFLGISIFTDTCDGSPNIAYSVSGEFTQRVKLLRRPFATVTGSTWKSHWSGMCSKRELPDMVEMGIITLGVDSFIDHYLTANPKK